MFDLIEIDDKHCDVRDIIVYICVIIVDLIGTDKVRYLDVIDIIAYTCIIIVELIGTDDVVDIIPCIIVITVMNLVLLFFLIC